MTATDKPDETPCEISDDAIAVITRALADRAAPYPELHRVVADTILNIHQLRRQRDEARARLPSEAQGTTPLDEILAKLESKPSPVVKAIPISQSLLDALSDASDDTDPHEGTPKAGPCGNEDCDACYPIPRWRVSQHRVQHITREKALKANTREEALALYEKDQGPGSYMDDLHGGIVQLDSIVVEKIENDERVLPPDWQCWHRL